MLTSQVIVTSLGITPDANRISQLTFIKKDQSTPARQGNYY